jgi:flagellar protein FliS
LEGKAENLSKANAIINALLESLDAKDDSEVINNLASLYDYMLSRITDASIEKSVEPIDEVMLLLREIKSAWDAIPYEEVKKALDIQAEMAS